MDDDQPATAETIIHALSQFGAQQEQEHGQDQSQEGEHASTHLEDYSNLLSNQGIVDQHDLGELTRGELEAEVLKLRGLVYQEQISTTPAMELAPAVKRQRRAENKVSEKNSVDVQTGKRVERGRKTELYKAIRQTMRVSMGMENEADPLPIPRLAETSTAGHPVWEVPDWQTHVGTAANARWMENIANQLYQDLQSEINPYTRVEDTDKDLPTILEAVKVTFANYVKRYKSENDSTHAERKAKYAKNRRRWARKDLEKRSKARTLLDPSHPYTSLPQSALLFTYQSSEHSTSGSDSSDSDDVVQEQKVKKRKEMWANMRNMNAGPSGEAGKEYGWGIGLSSKVLEVRTPSWRSEKLNEYYVHLDSLSDVHAQNRNTPRSQRSRSATTITTMKQITKAGHVAPSHRRFTLPPDIRRMGMKRSGKSRKRKVVEGNDADDDDEGGDEGLGERWMWATGKVGVWPPRTRSKGGDDGDAGLISGLTS